ncbi:MAG TPA: tetratricopeptide repeat protein, partial [Caulifigura sp.]|nr:tetratricopeptide repeat protein [Caulifigura sp.]
IWMAVSCLRNDPERHLWLWLIIFLPGVGPLIYFCARWLPSTRIEPPKAFRRYLRGGELKRLQIAAKQIGNAHQFVEWGEALRDSGQANAAHDAFEKALAKDGQNLQALWGAACVEYDRGDYTEARGKLERILRADPAYKFGDVSLLHCKTLNALGEVDAAREQLENHTRRWRHPEGLYLLATIYADQGKPAEARKQLEALIQDLDGAPRKIVRRQLFWRGRARKLLRKLPAA